jgi:hypothetical protein
MKENKKLKRRQEDEGKQEVEEKATDEGKNKKIKIKSQVKKMKVTNLMT